MKKTFFPLVFAVMFIAIASFIISGCTKEGPAGPAGANGIDGTDGGSTCVECHNFEGNLLAKVTQYEGSTHGTGANFERNGTSCAPCHTHQGFIEVLETGLQATAAEIMDPNRINCRSCHEIHQTFTSDDWNLTKPDESTLWLTGTTIDIGKGNVCTNCHQPRIPDPYPSPGDPDVTITSSYWGLHYGTQSAILAGVGGYEVAGSQSYTTSSLAHVNSVEDGCVTCHMGDAYGNQAGGHTWNMSYEYHGSDRNWTANCETCHSGISNFDHNGVQTDIQLHLDSLENMLIADSIMDNSHHIIPGTWTANQAGAVLNYNMVRADGSLGVHNSKYAKALLVNSIESL